MDAENLGQNLGTFAQPQQERPNIVYILVDNWGWGDIGVQGSTVPTPRLEHSL